MPAAAEPDHLRALVDGAMGLAGIELDPGDIDLIRRIHDLLRAMVEPFEGLDLSVHPAEIGLDPGRPPSDG